jgi:hypothetical protein
MPPTLSALSGSSIAQRGGNQGPLWNAEASNHAANHIVFLISEFSF